MIFQLKPVSLAILVALSGTAAVPLWAQDNANASEDAQTMATHDVERAKKLDEITVTATPLLQTEQEIIEPVSILSGADLDNQKAGTLGETVSKQAGVQTTFFGAGVGRPIIRGQDAGRVQVLQNNATSMDVSAVSNDHAVAVEPFLADQIEILKGPATLFYGPSAIGGAVNVVDGRIPEVIPEAPLSGRAEFSMDSVANQRTGAVRLDGTAGSFVWHLDVFGRQAGDYSIPGYAKSEFLRAQEHEEHEEHEHHDDHDGHDDHDDHEEHEEKEAHKGSVENSGLNTVGGAFGLSYVGDRGFVGVSMSHYESDYGIPGGAHAHHGEEDHDEHDHDDDHDDDDHHDDHDDDHGDDHDHDDDHGDDHDDHEDHNVNIALKQKRYDVKAGINQPFEGMERFVVRYAQTDYKHTEFEEDEMGTHYFNEGQELRAELTHAPLGNWRGALGVQYSNQDFLAIGEEAFVPATESNGLGVFLVERGDFDPITVELGLRADQNEVDAKSVGSRSFDTFSFSGNASWRFHEYWGVSLVVDHAQRAPGAEELFANGVHTATQSFEVGDAKLNTETAKQIELGLHAYGDRFHGHASVYQNKVDDYIYLNNTGKKREGLALTQWVQADATFRGFEIEGSYDFLQNDTGEWTLNAFADHVRATLDQGGYLPRISPTRVGMDVAWTNGPWRASLGAVHGLDQDNVAANERASKAYILVDAHLAYHTDNEHFGMEFFLDVKNLSNQEVRLHTSMLRDYAPLPGRNVIGGVRVFF